MPDMSRCTACGDTGRVFSFDIDAEVVCHLCDGEGGTARTTSRILVDRLAARGVRIPPVLLARTTGIVAPSRLIVPPAGTDGMGLEGDEGSVGWHRRAPGGLAGRQAPGAWPLTGTDDYPIDRRASAGTDPLAGTDAHPSRWRAPTGADAAGGHRRGVNPLAGTWGGAIGWRAPGGTRSAGGHRRGHVWGDDIRTELPPPRPVIDVRLVAAIILIRLFIRRYNRYVD